MRRIKKNESEKPGRLTYWFFIIRKNSGDEITKKSNHCRTNQHHYKSSPQNSKSTFVKIFFIFLSDKVSTISFENCIVPNNYLIKHKYNIAIILPSYNVSHVLRPRSIKRTDFNRENSSKNSEKYVKTKTEFLPYLYNYFLGGR